MKDLQLNTEIVNINTLRPNPNNPRTATREAMDRLKRQIEKLGQYKPIIIDTRTGLIIGGHRRYDALKEIGVDNVWVSYITSDNDTEALEYMLSDNDNVGVTEKDQLLALIDNCENLNLNDYATNFEEPETLDHFMEQFKNENIEEDEFPEVDAGEPVSKLGEVYQLGRHRLMCGDSMKIDDVKILLNNLEKTDIMLTDPPYGINVVGKNGNIGGGTDKIKVNTYRPIENDNVDLDLQFLLPLANESIIWGGNYLSYKLPKGGRWIVWDKDRNEGLSFSDCELAWTNIDGVVVKKYTIRWDGYSREGEKKEALHPTMKSVKLMASILEDYTKVNSTVSDYFGGSGSTLIACEQTNRICYMMELDPRYCDVIRKRYAKFIGKENEWESITKCL